MRISYWISDVCSSDLFYRVRTAVWHFHPRRPARHSRHRYSTNVARLVTEKSCDMLHRHMALDRIAADHGRVARRQLVGHAIRSEEHTSELQSLMRLSYAVFCLKKTNTTKQHTMT